MKKKFGVAPIRERGPQWNRDEERERKKRIAIERHSRYYDMCNYTRIIRYHILERSSVVRFDCSHSQEGIKEPRSRKFKVN